MGVNYNATVKSARMVVVRDAIDANASPAFIEICTAGFAGVLVTITLSDPAFAEATAVLTMQGTPKSGVATGAGTAAVARIKDGGGTVVVNNLTVSTSGADINLDGLAVTVGKTVTLTSGTITHST